MSIELTEFARVRLFPKSGRRNALTGCSASDFQAHINAHEPLKISPGYADFCRLYIYKNWTTTRCAVIKITADNQHLLRSAYEARTRKELAVLNRWFEGLEAPLAKYLMVILYSREQLLKEGDSIDADWGVVGCLATDSLQETPLAPITMLRNALGVEEGGSGVAIDKDAYQRSVDFWDQHANWRVPK